MRSKSIVAPSSRVGVAVNEKTPLSRFFAIHSSCKTNALDQRAFAALRGTDQ
jgi:hypothetical protein